MIGKQRRSIFIIYFCFNNKGLNDLQFWSEKVMKKEKPDYASILKGIPGFDILEPEQLKKIAAIVNIQ